jgi:hypothetical protein
MVRAFVDRWVTPTAVVLAAASVVFTVAWTVGSRLSRVEDPVAMPSLRALSAPRVAPVAAPPATAVALDAPASQMQEVPPGDVSALPPEPIPSPTVALPTPAPAVPRAVAAGAIGRQGVRAGSGQLVSPGITTQVRERNDDEHDDDRDRGRRPVRQADHVTRARDRR